MIETWYNSDHKSKKEIAELLYQDERTIMREIKRGLVVVKGYYWEDKEQFSALVAQEKYYYNKTGVILDEILDLVKKESSKLDYKELEECVNNHNIGLELRKKVLQLVALKLLYSNNTTAERGYERAKRFIGEFNKHIPNLNLTTKEIDKIIQRDYKQSNEMLHIEQKEPVKVHKLNLKSVERFIKDFARVK